MISCQYLGPGLAAIILSIRAVNIIRPIKDDNWFYCLVYTNIVFLVHYLFIILYVISSNYSFTPN